MHKEHNKTFEQILHERYSPKWCEVRHNRKMRAASLLANRINMAYRFFQNARLVLQHDPLVDPAQ